MWKLSLSFLVLANFGTPIFGEGERRIQNETVKSLPSSTIGCILNAKTPNPLNTRTYYHCSSNGPILMKCPETMVFEAASSACIKDNTPPPGEKSGCTSTGFFASTNCEKFYRCVDFYGNGQYTVFWFDCPAGTLFDERISVCNWPYQMTCNAGNDAEEGKIIPDVVSANEASFNNSTNVQ